MAPSTAFSIGSGLVTVGSQLFAGNKSLPQPGMPTGLYALQQQSTDNEANSQDAQATEALLEARDAEAQKALEASRFRENQASTYDNSGVMLQGSPMLVLNQTRALAAQEIDAISRRGQAQANLFYGQAANTRNSGRAAILGSQSSYFTSLANQRIAQIGNQPNIGQELTSLAQGAFGGPQANALKNPYTAQTPTTPSTPAPYKPIPGGNIPPYRPQP